MPVVNLSAAMARVRRAIAPTAVTSQSDGQLLDAFVAHRDPDAFALLVGRHGPMVLSVCRRITGGRRPRPVRSFTNRTILGCRSRAAGWRFIPAT